MDGIVISATQGEQIKVERLFAGVVVDRYMTTDLRRAPGHVCHRAWIQDAVKLCSQGSAGVEVPVVVVPAPAPNLFERLEQLERELANRVHSELEACERARQLEQASPTTTCPECDGAGSIPLSSMQSSPPLGAMAAHCKRVK